MPAPVLSKLNFTTRYIEGEFGNHSPSFATPQELLDYGRQFPPTAPVPGLFHLRNRRQAGGTTYYNLSWSAAVAIWLDRPPYADWFVSQMVPPAVEQTLRLQGEVTRLPGGLYLYYSRLPLPQRTALAKDGRQVHGILAGYLLQLALEPQDYEWLIYLLDEYPEHTVEFGAYDREWGTLKRKMVVWEVRGGY